METSEKLILLGLGFIAGVVLVVVGLLLHLFPKHKVKKNWIVSAIGISVGTVLIIAGIASK